MITLTSKYMGLNLKNPIIIGSSGLTNSVEKVKKLAGYGAGAVVLKSLFEEQIMIDSYKHREYDGYYAYPESVEYIKNYSKQHTIDNYLQLIEKSKRSVEIPVIASINCISASEWISFAKKIEEAGADALELNISMLPTDEKYDSRDNEKKYFDISKKVKSQINIPVSIKMSRFSTGLANLILKLSWTKNVDGFVLFNRYYNPDIDISKMEVVSSNVFSTAEEITNSLRWIALLSDKVKIDLAASTGIHNGEGVIKQLLAGANAVQIVSAIYKHGPEYISTIIKEVEEWMEKNHFSGIDEFKGKMSYEKVKNPAAYERIQYMKYFSEIK